MEDHARSDTARDHVALFRGLHGKALLYRWPGNRVWDRNEQRADISAVVVEWKKTRMEKDNHKFSRGQFVELQDAYLILRSWKQNPAFFFFKQKTAYELHS